MKAWPLIAASWLTATAFAAQASGEPYGALGTEPFWGFSVADGRIEFDVTGWPEYTYSAPAPAREATARGYRYRTPRLTAEIWREDCNDGMTERMFADSVVVTMDGRQFEGCGGDILSPETLAGSSWGIDQIAGTAAEDSQYSIAFAPEEDLIGDFAPGTFRGFSPCNAFFGRYDRTGDMLALHPLTSDAHDCTAAQRRLDARLQQILEQPLRIAFTPDGVFTLTGERGSLRLSR